jgi:GcrA cell cycle regulator
VTNAPWPDASIATLREMWAAGISTVVIGRRLGVSKNAVVGKAHRLDLPSRDSPIRRKGDPQQPPRPRAPRAPAVTLPPLPSYTPPPVVAAPVVVECRPAPPPPPARPMLTELPSRGGICLWTEGEPGAWLHCPEPRVWRDRPGATPCLGPFCLGHSRRGFERREARGGEFVLRRLGAG